MKIVAVTTVASPYIVARYRRFTELYPSYELTLVEYGRVSSEYAWAPYDEEVPFGRVVLSDRPIQSQARATRNGLIQGALNEIQPNVLVVCGYGVTGMGAALQWARTGKREVPLVMLSDSTAGDEVRRSWKEHFKRRIIGQCGSALVAGSRHREYLRDLGMPDQHIFEGYDVVDNRYFEHGVTAARRLGRVSDLPEAPFFLASNRFVPKKNLLRLLEAFAGYRQVCTGNKWHLVLLGDGEMRPAIEAKIASCQLEGSVHLIGFRQYDDLASIYARAGAFIHASTVEQWGLVVNEAMASGLPVIVSERCGCAPDLVQNGVNGYTFDPYDVDALAQLMLTVSSNECDRSAMGRASREIIRSWSPDLFADGLARAVAAAMAAPTIHASRFDKLLLWGLAHR